jgi:photosystem II stability/assembly factor-like uncharacterized protein
MTSWAKGYGPNLSSISCASVTMCIAVGQQFFTRTGSTGFVMSTNDGGVTWRSTPERSASDLRSVSCSSVLSCQAVGDAYTSNATVVLGTTDGGDHWSLVAGTNWVVKTPNHWPKDALFDAFTAIDCPTIGLCVAVGGPGLTGLILRITDAGRKWSSQVLRRTMGLTGLTCLAGSTCIAVGPSRFLTTHDGGVHWVVRPLPLAGSVAVGCMDAHRCVISGNSEYFDPEDSYSDAVSLVETTTDAGSTWHLIPPHPAIGPFWGISCGSASTCMSIGYNARGEPLIVRTRDGGRTWTEHRVPRVSGKLNSIACPSPDHCIVAADNGLLTTHDDGGSWRITRPNAHGGNWVLVTCTSTSDCQAWAGSGGIHTPGYETAAFRTSDGGTTWQYQSQNSKQRVLSASGSITSVSTPEGMEHSGIACPTPTTCLGTGQGYRQIGSNLEAYDFACPTVKECMAVGYLENDPSLNASQAVVSGDGGVTWSPPVMIPGVAGDITGLACASSTLCFVVGQDQHGGGVIVAYHR